VDSYFSEKEQVEQVKAWLRANLPWILAGIAVGSLAIGGWRWWQGHTDQLALQASAAYQQVLEAFNAGDKDRGLALIGDLERDHSGSPYTDQANLAAARVLVETNELERAAQRLASVERESRDPQLAAIATLRLARVQVSLGKPDEALATLGQPPTGAFASRFHEVRGDAYYAKGEKAAALDEYRAARSAAGSTLAENDVLNLKINDLTGVSDAAAHQKQATQSNVSSGAGNATAGSR
jgi:predicted negative regulator of RcsB-dependent stress response